MLNGENINNINMNIKIQGNNSINVYKICKRAIDIISAIIRNYYTLPTCYYCVYCK